MTWAEFIRRRFSRPKISKSSRATVLDRDRECRRCGFPNTLSDRVIDSWRRRYRCREKFGPNWRNRDWLYGPIDQTRAAVTAMFQDGRLRVSDFAELQIDHVFPVAKGGRVNVENLQVLCSHCNASKGDRLPHPSSKEPDPFHASAR